MLTKYNIEIDNEIINARLKQLINLIYKILPMREESEDWKTLLSTIIEEIVGMSRLFKNQDANIWFSLICKLEGLFELEPEDKFFDFRRTIFECLSMIGKVKENVSIK